MLAALLSILPGVGSGVLSARIKDHFVLVPVTIGARESWALLDTGSDLTSFSQAVADESDPVRFKVGGLERVAEALVPEETVWKNFEQRTGVKVEVLLGMDSLEGQSILIDYTAQRVEIAPQIAAAGMKKAADLKKLESGYWGIERVMEGKRKNLCVDTGSGAFILDAPPSGSGLIGSRLSYVLAHGSVGAYPAFAGRDFSLAGLKLAFVGGIVTPLSEEVHGLVAPVRIARNKVLIDAARRALFVDAPRTPFQTLRDTVSSIIGYPLLGEGEEMWIDGHDKRAQIVSIGDLPFSEFLKGWEKWTSVQATEKFRKLTQALSEQPRVIVKFATGEMAQVETLRPGTDPAYPHAPFGWIYLKDGQRQALLSGSKSGPWPYDTIASAPLQGWERVPVDPKDPKSPVVFHYKAAPEER